MSLPRLIATDLDGTLLDAEGALSPRTRRALWLVSEAGADVVFVTARPPRSIGSRWSWSATSR
ncbi:HAD hydrolase family protein [Nonomuraea dietziae]